MESVKRGQKKAQFSLTFVVSRVRGGGSRRLIPGGDCFRECGCHDPRFVQCGQHGSVSTRNQKGQFQFQGYHFRVKTIKQPVLHL